MIDRLGLVVPARYEAPMRRHVALAKDAERRGYGTVWSTEVSGADAIGLSCAISMSTERIQVGVGVLPAFTRTAPLLAMGAATLRSLAGNRAILGLGSSTPTVVAHWHGGDHGKPVTRLAETTAAIRTVLAHESRGFHGETVAFQGFDLAIAGDLEIPIYIAALGPKRAARAATYADGIIVTLNTVEDLALLSSRIREAAGGKRVQIVAYARVGINDDDAATERWMRREIAWYCSSKAYRDHLARQGFRPQVTAVADCWARRDTAAAHAAVDREMCARLSVTGSAQEVRARLRSMLEHVDQVACYFMDFGGGLDDIEAQMQQLA